MNKFMKLAIEEARKGIQNNDGGPFGACIVKNGKVIAKGHNRVVANNDPTCHGEIDAIRKACKKLKTFDLTGCDLYTTGEPCPMCACACLWANMNKIYYGGRTEDIANLGFKDEHFYKKLHITIPQNYFEECDRDACLQLFTDYKNIQNKTHY